MNIPVVNTVARGERRAAPGGSTGAVRVVWLFGLVVLGILASWFWDVGWEFLRDPSKGLPLGSWTAILVRTILSLIAAAVTFSQTYDKVNKSTRESLLPYFLAFQNGFFWDAAFNAIVEANQPAGPASQ